MFVYRSTLSRSKREDEMDERCKRTTHDAWLSGFHHGTYPRCHKGVVFTIGWIYFSLLLLPRCLFLGFHKGTFSFFLFWIFYFCIFLPLVPPIRLVPLVMLITKLIPHIKNFKIYQTTIITWTPLSGFHLTGIQITYTIIISNNPNSKWNSSKTTRH